MDFLFLLCYAPAMRRMWLSNEALTLLSLSSGQSISETHLVYIPCGYKHAGVAQKPLSGFEPGKRQSNRIVKRYKALQDRVPYTEFCGCILNTNVQYSPGLRCSQIAGLHERSSRLSHPLAPSYAVNGVNQCSLSKIFLADREREQVLMRLTSN